MHEPKIAVDPIKGFGMAKKEVAVRQQIVVELPDDLAFRSEIEINEHIAAEDDVHAFKRGHSGDVEHVDAGKRDLSFDVCVDAEFIAMCHEIFLAKVGRNVA